MKGIKMSDKILKVKNGDIIGSCNGLLKGFLESNKLAALLVPQEVPSKTIAFHVLISDPDQLNANIFAPVLPASSAAIMSKITRVRGADEAIGVVMRPCQIRALIELVKLNQANLNNIVIIGLDCPGTYPVNKYGDSLQKTDTIDFILDSIERKDSISEKNLRTACYSCKDPIPTNADIVIGIYGASIQKELVIQANTEVGKKLLDGVKLEVLKDGNNREKAVRDIRDERTKNRMEFIKKNSHIKGIEALSKFFDKCVNCHNCMKACPICYCRECLFESSLFDAEANRFLRKAERKGLYKMPNDSLLFHVTRMNHMILSCIGCGLCEQACPSEIPLMNLMIPVSENAQKELDYQPGKAIEEKIPMVVYREDEYNEIGVK